MKNFFSILTLIIIAVQETWFLPTDPYNFQLSNYTLYRCDELYGQRRHGGTALNIQNDYTHCQLDINTDLQAIACTTYINGRNIDVCSIYIPPDFDWQLNHLVTQFNNPFLQCSQSRLVGRAVAGCTREDNGKFLRYPQLGYSELQSTHIFSSIAQH